MPLTFPLLLAAVVGLCVGSFLNVVVHRLPLGRSVVRPRSACPACGQVLRAAELVPVLSYLVQRGRCRHCRARISAAYPLMEAATACVFAVVVWRLGLTVEALRVAVPAALLLAAAEIDRRHRRIPDRLTAAGAVLALGLAAATAPGALPGLLLAGLGCGALLWGIHHASRKVFGRVGLGLGDVKLGAMLGLWLGWDVLWVLYLAVVLGALLGLAGIALGRLTRTTPLPFAPFVAVAWACSLTALPADAVWCWATTFGGPC